MRKYLIVIVLVSLPAFMFSQNKEIKRCFNKYMSADGFNLTVTNSEFDIDLDKTYDFTNLINSVTEIYIMNIDSLKDKNRNADKFFEKLEKLVNQNGFKPMIDIESESSFSIMLKHDKSGMPVEMIMISSGGENPFCFWIY